MAFSGGVVESNHEETIRQTPNEGKFYLKDKRGLYFSKHVRVIKDRERWWKHYRLM